MRNYRSSRLTSSSVGQPLALDALKGMVKSVLVVDFQRRAVVIAPVEFGQIPVQVLRSAVLVGADHAALEDAERAFNMGELFQAAARRLAFPWCD